MHLKKEAKHYLLFSGICFIILALFPSYLTAFAAFGSLGLGLWKNYASDK